MLPIRPGPSAAMNAAPAPSANRAAVLRSVRSVTRVQQVGADHERVAHASGLDLRGAEAERGHEAGAGRADVAGGGAAGAELAGDQRRRVGQQLVLGEGRDEHELDVGAVDARGGERLAPGLGGERGQRAALAGVPALADARSARRSTRGRRRCGLGDLVVGHAVRRQRRGDGGDAGEPASRRTGAGGPGSISAVAMSDTFPGRAGAGSKFGSAPMSARAPPRRTRSAGRGFGASRAGDEGAQADAGPAAPLERGDAARCRRSRHRSRRARTARTSARGLDAEADGDRDVVSVRSARDHGRQRAPDRAGPPPRRCRTARRGRGTRWRCSRRPRRSRARSRRSTW